MSDNGVLEGDRPRAKRGGNPRIVQKEDLWADLVKEKKEKLPPKGMLGEKKRASGTRRGSCRRALTLGMPGGKSRQGDHR